MVKYAYTRNLPIQVVIGGNKESILNEKTQTARFHQTVAVGYSEVLIPDQYPDFEAFMDKIQITWDSEWNEVFSADWDGLPVLPEVPQPQFDYPADIKLIMVPISILNILIAAWAIKLTYRCISAVMALLGPLQWPIAVVVVVYLVASFIVYSQPEDALKVHRKMLEQRHLDGASAEDAGPAVDGKKSL